MKTSQKQWLTPSRAGRMISRYSIRNAPEDVIQAAKAVLQGDDQEALINFEHDHLIRLAKTDAKLRRYFASAAGYIVPVRVIGGRRIDLQETDRL